MAEVEDPGLGQTPAGQRMLHAPNHHSPLRLTRVLDAAYVYQCYFIACAVFV